MRFLLRIHRAHSVKATALVGVIYQISRPAVSLFTLPFLLSYLGESGLGIWLIALSFMGLIGFVSSGITASVVTAVGRANSTEQMEGMSQITTGATIITMLFGGLILLFTIPPAFMLDWEQMLGVSSDFPKGTVRALMIALAALTALSVVLSVPKQIMIGKTHGYIEHLLSLSGVFIGAILLVLGIIIKLPIWMLAVLFLIPQMLAVFCGGLIYLKIQNIPIFKFSAVDRTTLIEFWRDTLKMSGYQSSFAISSQSDLLLIGLMLGAPQTVAFGIAARVFSLPTLVATAVNYAIWPSLARADAAGQKEKVSIMFRRIFFLGSTLATIFSFGLFVFYGPLLELWLGNAVNTDPVILYGMIAWVFVATVVNSCDVLLRARQEYSFLMRSMMSMAGLNLIATIVLIPIMGPAGAIWGTVFGYCVAMLIPCIFKLRTLIGF